MAQNQAQGGNSMAAMLGNMQNKTQRPGMPAANYGAGMQAGLAPQGQVWRGPPPGQTPTPAGPQGGYPQMSPAAMQNMAGQLSAMQRAPGPQLQSGATGNMAGLGQAGNPMGQIGAGLGQAGARRPMPAPGAPGMGAGGGKAQQIAQLPGGPR